MDSRLTAIQGRLDAYFERLRVNDEVCDSQVLTLICDLAWCMGVLDVVWKPPQ